jgi:hypothetical protein
MTLVVYKNCKIEIESEDSTVSYSIWDSDGFLVANDDVELPVRAVIEDCKSLVDDYLHDPRAFH